MATVELTLPHHQYRIEIAPGLLDSLGDRVRSVAPHSRAGLLVDAAILQQQGVTAAGSLRAAGYDPLVHGVPSGEGNKHLGTVGELYSLLVDHKLERKSPLISLGGGVMGDTVGFVASTYLRGVPFIQCPTTLLSMVDASVGGKVGVNLPQGKNLVGSFYQPALVVIDTDTLRSLPSRELRCGLAECVKHGVIRDPSLFAWIGENLDAILELDSGALVELVRWNVQIKASVVMADEKETGERAHLNYGHTFAHAIEALQEYGADTSFHHGEAVSLGMVAATRLAMSHGLCDGKLLDKLIPLLDRIGLPTKANNLPDTAKLMDAMQLDKKVASGRIRFVLPTKLGAVTITDNVPASLVAQAWDSLRG